MKCSSDTSKIRIAPNSVVLPLKGEAYPGGNLAAIFSALKHELKVEIHAHAVSIA